MPVKIFGYYHHQNAGDDAFSLFFRQTFPDLGTSFITDRSECPRVARLILGGGAVINEYFFNKLPDFDRLDVIGCSVGGGGDQLNLLAGISDKLGIVALRSQREVDLARAMGISAEYYPDIVFGLNGPRPTMSASPIGRLGEPKIALSQAKKTAIVLLSDHYSTQYSLDPRRFMAIEDFKDELASAFDALTDEYNLIFVPMSAFHNARDSSFAHDVTRRMKKPALAMLINQYLGPERILDIIASTSDVVISMRFHGLVFGLLCGKPIINIGDEPKNIDLMRSSALSDYSIPIETINREKFSATVRSSALVSERARLVAKHNKDAVQPLIKRLRQTYIPKQKSALSTIVNKFK